MAAETYGYVGTFFGDLRFENPVTNIPLESSYVQNYKYDTDTVNSGIVNVKYDGTSSASLIILGEEGTYLNGYATTYVTLTSSDTVSGSITMSLRDPGIDGISAFLHLSGFGNNRSVYLLGIHFQNFEVTSDKIQIPLVYDVLYSQVMDSSLHSVASSKWINVSHDEWVDDIVQYDDIRDLPGYYGDSSRQNQQIIESIDENTSAVNDAASYIGNKIQYYTDLLEKSIVSSFNALTTNLFNWYNGLISNLNTNFERLLNQNNDEHE